MKKNSRKWMAWILTVSLLIAALALPVLAENGSMTGEVFGQMGQMNDGAQSGTPPEMPGSSSQGMGGAPSGMPGGQGMGSAPSGMPGNQGMGSAPSGMPGDQSMGSAPSGMPGDQGQSGTSTGTTSGSEDEQTGTFPGMPGSGSQDQTGTPPEMPGSGSQDQTGTPPEMPGSGSQDQTGTPPEMPGSGSQSMSGAPSGMPGGQGMGGTPSGMPGNPMGGFIPFKTALEQGIIDQDTYDAIQTYMMEHQPAAPEMGTAPTEKGTEEAPAEEGMQTEPDLLQELVEAEILTEEQATAIEALGTTETPEDLPTEQPEAEASQEQV